MNIEEKRKRDVCIHKCTFHRVNQTDLNGIPVCDVDCDEFEVG